MEITIGTNYKLQINLLAQLVKFLMVVYEICDSILAYTKNWLVSSSDDKELLLGADTIGWNSLSLSLSLKKKKKKTSCYVSPKNNKST